MPCLTAIKRVLGSLLVGLAFAVPQARAEWRGKVHILVNPDAPRVEWRRVPLRGAYVAVAWSITVPAPVHAITTCRYSEFARSDEKGEFVMEGPNFVTAALADTHFLVYSPGSEPVPFPYEGSLLSAKDITMVRATRPSHERLSRIAALSDPQCPDTKLNDPRGLLGAFHNSLLDEARRLQVDSPRGRIDLQGIEAAARRAFGPEQSAPLRAVIKSPGSIQSNSPVPGQK